LMLMYGICVFVSPVIDSGSTVPSGTEVEVEYLGDDLPAIVAADER